MQPSAVCVNMFEVYNSKSMKAYLIVSYSLNHQHMHFQDTLHGSSLLLLMTKVGDLKTIPIFHIFNYVPISPYFPFPYFLLHLYVYICTSQCMCLCDCA